jgi:hypothetical protein
MRRYFACALFCCLVLSPLAAAGQDGFTQADRDLLIRLSVRMDEMEKRMVDLREDMNKRFEQQTTFLWMIVGIFTAIAAANIGFAYWDRRTAVNRAREETIQIIEKDGRLRDVIQALRNLAQDDPRVANVLRQFHLL